MDAFMYAAGRALRLGEQHTERPKILIEFGGKSILEWHVQRLSAVGVKRLHLVIGYRHEMIQEQFGALKEKYGVKFNGIVNDRFTDGSVVSLYCSLPRILNLSASVLLMDGDVLYPSEMLRRLIRSPRKTLLLLDREYSTADDDPVLVPVRDGKPFEFKKKWEGTADLVGESIGFFKVSKDDIPMLVKEATMRAEGEGQNESYDEVLRAMVLDGRFDYEDVTGIPWTEVDFPSDVQLAQERILPAIEDYEKKHA